MRRWALALLWLAGNATLLALPVVLSRAWDPLFAEDRLVETGTALLFLAAFAAGAALLIALRPARHRVLLLTASLLGLVGFLDEISFGARLFGWSMPEMAGGGELDGVHDLVILGYRTAAASGPIVLAAVLAGLALCVLLVALIWRARLLALARRSLTEPAYGLFALCLGGIATAAVLDLEIGLLARLGPLEEIVELNAALALLLAVVWTARAPSKSRSLGPGQAGSETFWQSLSRAPARRRVGPR